MFVVVPLVRLYRVLAVRSSLLAKRLRERVSVKAGAREGTTFFFPFFFSGAGQGPGNEAINLVALRFSMFPVVRFFLLLLSFKDILFCFIESSSSFL